MSETIINRVRELVNETSAFMRKLGIKTRCTEAVYSEKLMITCDSPSPGVALFSGGERIPDESGEWIYSWKSPVIRLSAKQVSILGDPQSVKDSIALVESLIVHELVHYLQAMRVSEKEAAVKRDPSRLDDAGHTADYFNQRIEIEAIAVQSLHYYSRTKPSKIKGIKQAVELRNTFLLQWDIDAAIQLGLKVGTEGGG